MEITMNRIDADGWATDEEITIEVHRYQGDESATIWTPFGSVDACEILTDAEMDRLNKLIAQAEMEGAAKQ